MRELKFRVLDKEQPMIEPRLGLTLLNAQPFVCDIIGFNKIIQQWTGVTDKNGRDIYEGDIVDATLLQSPDRVISGTVKFHQGCFYVGFNAFNDFSEFEVKVQENEK